MSGDLRHTTDAEKITMGFRERPLTDPQTQMIRGENRPILDFGYFNIYCFSDSTDEVKGIHDIAFNVFEITYSFIFTAVYVERTK